MKATESSLRLTPTAGQLELFRLEAEYSIDKARATLGYTPQVDVAQGLDFCVSWLRHHGLPLG
jgi:nucleoside-diphosphate-sugar epimerase